MLARMISGEVTIKARRCLCQHESTQITLKAIA
jgi:hypothetical protein